MFVTRSICNVQGRALELLTMISVCLTARPYQDRIYAIAVCTTSKVCASLKKKIYHKRGTMYLHSLFEPVKI